MRVDRSQFLLLASAIAAGCAPRHNEAARDPTVATTHDDAGAPAPIATVAPPKHAPSEEGVVGAPWSAGEGGAWPSGEGYYPPPPHEGGWPAQEGATWPSAEGYPGPAAEGGPSPTLKAMGVPVSSWTCSGSDDLGKPAYCAIKVPKSCAPFPFVGQSCRGARKYFKAKIAERSVACMHKLTPDGVCNAMTYDCRDAALRSACPDPAADAACQQLSKSCPKMSMQECRTYMNGLNAAGRAEVVKCMSTPSGCGYGVYSCVEGLND